MKALLKRSKLVKKFIRNETDYYFLKFFLMEYSHESCFPDSDHGKKICVRLLTPFFSNVGLMTSFM
jgi:hypothetical protein